MYSHRSQVLHSLAQAMPDAPRHVGADVILPVVPMFHANAWGVPLYGCHARPKMVFPGPHLRPGRPDPAARERSGSPSSCGVPDDLAADGADPGEESRKVEARPRAAPDRRRIGRAGSDDPRLRRLGIQIIQGWGMTETSPASQHLKITAQQERLTEDQRFAVMASKAVRAACRHPNDRRCRRAALGRQDYGRAPGARALDHWQLLRPADAENFADDGWLRTGDVAAIDPLGFIKIADRTKDLIKSGGEWISSVELENAIMGHAAVRESAVIAVAIPSGPSARWR